MNTKTLIIDNVKMPIALEGQILCGVDSSGGAVTLGASPVTSATGILTSTGTFTNAQTVTIGAKVYTALAVLTDVDGNFLIGANQTASHANLLAAINLTAGAGTTYATSTTANADVFATGASGTTTSVQAIIPGDYGNNIVTTETLTNASWGNTTLGGGNNGTLRTNERDLFIVGAPAQSSANNNAILATPGTAATDTAGPGESYRSFTCQINGGAGIASGAITFEGSNDNVNFSGIIVVDEASNFGNLITSAVSISSSTQRYFSGKCSMRYIRARISTGFSGGTIQAFTRFSVTEFVPRIPSVNVVGTAGSGTSTGNGTNTGALRVAIASDNTANSNPWLSTLVPSAAQGASTSHHLISAASTNATSVKASAGTINDGVISNSNAAARFFKLYNKASAPTVGTDTPILTLLIPPGVSMPLPTGPYGLRCSTGIAYALTTGIAVADTGAVAADLSVHLNYT